jgi:adenylate cyclase
MSETRKIAAILVSDVVGYSRLAGADEERISGGCGRCAAI